MTTDDRQPTITETSLALPDDFTYDDWLDYGHNLSRLNHSAMWWLGDWWAFGEHHYGDKIKAATGTAWAYQTCVNAGNVAKKIESNRRRLNLPWSYHAEVAALNPADQEYFLDRWASALPPRNTARAEVAARKNELTQRDPIPPKTGTYRAIVIDPPWPMPKIQRLERPYQVAEDGSDGLDYPTLSLEQIADETIVPVRTHAANDGCHLYLWVTHKYLPAGLELLDAWGFHYQCVMTWRKNVGITPFSWMYDTEHVLFATCGNLPLERKGLRLSFEAPVQGHSVKPDVFYERVTEASPGPRIDMFARRERDGFDVWGNEVADAI